MGGKIKDMTFEQTVNKPEVGAAKEVLREAFESILTEKIEKGPKARIDKGSSAMQAVADFCKKVNVEYPKTAGDVETLIERLDSPEFDEQIGAMLSQ